MTTVATRKPATIQDVASAAGVTKATVSFVLSGKRQVTPRTKELVLRAAQELGYSPNLNAQSLSNGRSTTAIRLFTLRLGTPQSVDKARLLQDTLRQKGFDATLHGYGDFNEFKPVEQTALVNSLRRQRPQAIICETNGLNQATLDELRHYAMEGGIVVAYDMPTDLPCDQVLFDRVDNTYQATKHLLQLGHRDIGIFVPAPAPDLGTAGPRQEGFAQAHQEFGLTPRPEWCFFGSNGEKGGASLAKRFLALPPGNRPSAMAVVNDYSAITFMLQLERAGIRVPRDLSVVGHDNSPMAEYFSTPLTTITHPVDEIVAAVADRVLQRLAKSEVPPCTISVRGELKLRESATAYLSKRP